MSRARLLFLVATWLVGAAAVAAAPAGDDWVAGSVVYPAAIKSGAIQGFETLNCEVIAGKLKVSWISPETPTNARVVLWTSFDAPGHWPARSWRSQPMIGRPGSWDFSLPVPHLDLPVVYFITATVPGRSTNSSAMRVCHPRAAGLEEITRPFWPFLEGFEEGLENWRLAQAAPAAVPLVLNTNTVNGYAALQLTIPPGRRSAAVSTTVVRGWHLDLFAAKGMRLWLRTVAGAGTVRFALTVNHGTTNQAIFPAAITVPVGPEWRKSEVLFDMVPELQRAEVDLLTLEFQSETAPALLVDDLSLLGRWRLELE